MRRKEREITAREEILDCIQSCKVCRIGMVENGKPYIVPMNFGYTWQEDTLKLYFHSAQQGRKIDILTQNPTVCFEMDSKHQLIAGETACSHSFFYQSVLGEGEVTFLEDPQQKIQALAQMMHHQTGKDFTFTPEQVERVAVFVLTATTISAKAHKQP